MKPASPAESKVSKGLFWYRLKLLSLIGVFLAPFILGWVAFYVLELRPDSGNYGMLVQPVRKISLPLLETIDGERFENGFGRKWTLLLFAGESCSAQCRSNLFYMRQTRILLGRDTPRLQNLLVSAGTLSAETKRYLRDFPQLKVIENYLNADLYQQFYLAGFGAVGDRPKMYLVDPAQNLMMHYAAESDQNRVLEDIKKLMKLSQIG